MKLFLDWFNADSSVDAVLKATIAHLWFVTIHPFDDGNGRIARTITDMQLTKADEQAARFYSMSAQIRVERKTYYDTLEQTQKGGLDITAWLVWFLQCLIRTLDASETLLQKVLYKAKYWNTIGMMVLSERQNKMINKLLDSFEGNLTSAKWRR